MGNEPSFSPPPGPASDDPSVPPACRKGADFPLLAVFLVLRKRWVETVGYGALSRLAAWLDVSPATVSNWTRGKPVPPWWVILALAHALGMVILVQPEGIQVRKRRSDVSAKPSTNGKVHEKVNSKGA